MSQFANAFGSDPDEYVRSLLALVGDRDPLALLPELPSRIEELLRDLGDTTLRKPEREGKWSLLMIARHLADSELVFAFRYRMILGNDTPPLAGYDQDAWAQNLRYAEADLDETLELLRVVRNANVRMLRALTPEQRKRGGLHSERGFEDMERLMCLHAAHDIVHTRQLERVRAAVA
ncbi:MAG TPA: DinB family protein [Thermoanaerobaculia bacterium]|jgi:hypothetical protein